MAAGKKSNNLKIGIFGGTYNPVHIGHLRAAEEVCEKFDLDLLYFIPAARPPHKDLSHIAPYEYRRKMLELAIADNNRFNLSDIEKERPGKSYSVDTLTALRHLYPHPHQLYFLLGFDAFLEITTWKDYKRLFRLTSFVILTRGGLYFNKIEQLLRTEISADYKYGEGVEGFVHPELEQVFLCQVTSLDISSTRVRYLISQERSIRYLVPEEVRRYIEKEMVYQLVKDQ